MSVFEVSATRPPEASDSVSRSTALLQVELRALAKTLVERVAAGSSPRPVTPDLARAMAQVAFSHRPTGFGVSRPAFFAALLSHPDIPEDVLEWVAHDMQTYQQDVFPSLVAHPAFSFRVLLTAVEMSMWSSRGSVDLPEWSVRNPLVSTLERSGHAGRCAALLLGVWADADFAAFASTLESLVAAPDHAVEIFETLASDLRSLRRVKAYRLPSSSLEMLVDQASLLAEISAPDFVQHL